MIYFLKLRVLGRDFIVLVFKMTNGILFLADTCQIVKHFLPVVIIRKLTAVLLVVVSFFLSNKYLNFSWTELDL